ncbi:MAG: hemerythrin family protein [Amphritea sp.]|nr:hemerythrin family protein [Amphritea sp.]
MPLIEASQIPSVALDFMNDDHAEAASQINNLDALLNQATQEGLNESLKTAISDELQHIYQHSEEHFAREEAEMVRTGFPAYGCHKGEHERVLQELQQIASLWQQEADLNMLSDYVKRGLPEWLGNHIATMDTVTAMFVTRFDLSAA